MLPEKQHQSKLMPFYDAFWPETNKKMILTKTIQFRGFLRYTDFILVLKVWERFWRKEIKILKFAVDWEDLPAKMCMHRHYQKKHMKKSIDIKQNLTKLEKVIYAFI